MADDTALFDPTRPWITQWAADHATYSAEKDYDAADFGPVPETDPAVLEALVQEQLEHLKEAGFTANG